MSATPNIGIPLTHDEMRMLASCVFSCREAAKNELLLIEAGLKPASDERVKDLRALVAFAMKFLGGATGSQMPIKLIGG